MKLVGLLLAAGESRRLGQPKQLVPWNEHYTLLERQIMMLKQCVDSVVVVTGAFNSDIAPICNNHNVDVIFNELWHKGQGGSIASGIRFIDAHNADAVMILLSDQWMLTADDLKQLVETYKSSHVGIAVSVDNSSKRFSPPAIFSRSYFSVLSLLEGESGAKKLFLENVDDIVSVNIENAFVDLDEPSDLTRYLKSRNQ